MKMQQEKSFFYSLKGKVIAVFALGSFVFLLFWLVVQFAFKEVLTTVAHFTNPNEKLRIVNRLHEDISKLDYTQRTIARQQAGLPRTFLRESQNILLSLDTLKKLDTTNHFQVNLLDSMEIIIIKRDKLLLSYLDARSDLLYNTDLSKKIGSISDLLSNNAPTDSNIITTNKTVTTTTTIETDGNRKNSKKKSWLGRLFSGKNKDSAVLRQTLIKKELDINIDTLSVAVQDSVIQLIGEIMQNMEKDQFSQSIRMLNKELELARSNYKMVNQLLRILNDLEDEELGKVKYTNQLAGEQVNESIHKIEVILLFSFFGAAVLVFLIFTDISKSNKYRLELIKSRDEAEKLGNIKQQFLANMSHEIRTPLQSIIGYSEQVKKQASPNPKALEAIHTSSGHLLQIVDELLDYSRISSGKFSFNAKPFDLKKLIDEVLEVMSLQATEKKLELEHHHHLNSSFWIKADAFRLKQILFNLLGNAIKFTEMGKVTVTVKHKISENIAHCVFIVEDTGRGIEEKHLGRIFDSFEQENAEITQSYKGTGLGLTIVKALVESQNGHISVRSKIGKGTTFTITLSFPCASEPDSHEHSSLKPTPAFGGKVLVVDDDQLILQLCEMIFVSHHIEYVVFNDPVTLKNATWDNTVTHVFLDIRMPGINGFELCRHIRSVSRSPVKITALTAQALPGDIDMLVQEGFDAVLTKPFTEKDILEALSISPEIRRPVLIPDLANMKKMTLGDTQLMEVFLKSYYTETESDIQTVADLIQQNNTTEIREVLHKLAGRTGQVGALDLSLAIRAVEISLEHAALHERKQDLLQVMEQVVLFQKELEQKISEINPVTG